MIQEPFLFKGAEQSKGNGANAPDPQKKSQLGQFFTPKGIARFMAEMFPGSNRDECRLLDAGAGAGSLSSAFLDRCANGGFNFRHVTIDAFEIDHCLHQDLGRALNKFTRKLNVEVNIRGADFIHNCLSR